MKHIILLSIVLFSISNGYGQNKTINKPADSIINKIKALNDSRETKLVGKPLATFSLYLLILQMLATQAALPK